MDGPTSLLPVARRDLGVWPVDLDLTIEAATGVLPAGTWTFTVAADGPDTAALWASTATSDGATGAVTLSVTADQWGRGIGEAYRLTFDGRPLLEGWLVGGTGTGVAVPVIVDAGDGVTISVTAGAGLSEVEVQALIDAAVAGLDPGVVLSDATPQAPGAAGPGVSVEASRADHRHAPPTAGQIGAATPADIEAAIDALPGPPTALSAVSTLDMSGGSWTVLPWLGLPRMLIVGLPVLVLSGDDRGLWTVTASGPCTPLPDPGGAVIAVTALQAVASPIVDQMGQPAGWVLGPSAETVTALGSTVTALESTVSSLESTVSSLESTAPRGYRLLAGQPYDGGAIKSGTAVTTQNRVAWTTLEGIALGAQVDALWVDVTTGGSTGATVQLSLLADDGWGRPGDLLAQTAQLPAETSTAIVMGTFGAVTLTTSTIHIGVHVRSTAQPTLRAISSRATCIPTGGASTSNTMAWSSTIAGAAVAANPAVVVSSAACYRAGIRGA